MPAFELINTIATTLITVEAMENTMPRPIVGLRMTFVTSICMVGVLIAIIDFANVKDGSLHWKYAKSVYRNLLPYFFGRPKDKNYELDARGLKLDEVKTPVTNIGIHLSSPSSTESFANLVIGGKWIVRTTKRPYLEALADLDQNGNLKTLKPGNIAVRYLTPPSGGNTDVLIECTYVGKGMVEVAGPSVETVKVGHGSFKILWNPGLYPASLNIMNTDHFDPVRDIDCRDARTPREVRFAPQFLNLIKGLKVLRFMDWQNTNLDMPVTWATRHTPKALAIGERDGVSIEDMVALARINGSDAWFNMPSRADDDYIRHFARYVRDNMPSDRKIYVELGNEVWNWSFPVSRHVMQEGLDRHMGRTAKEAISFRYADRLIHVMDIWADVFRKTPSRLVRVSSGQNGDTYRSKLILDYADLPRHVDAFATAPYFDYDRSGNPSDLAEIFRRIDTGIEATLRDAEAQKALAAEHGLRFIAYEAGQGIALKNVALNVQIQRDQRMFSAYCSYLNGWRSRIGDTIILFGTVFQTRPSGAWGLLEYAGQPMSESPKLTAARSELR